MALWGLEWYSKNRLDGERRHIVYEKLMPALFKTRQQARNFATEKYGYIKTRKDLRAEPHGWRFPRAVRVKVIKQETPND